MIQFTYYGHACFAVTLSSTTILFDPFITPNPLAKHISLDSIKADFIFISHGHGDHLADVVTLAQKTKAMCIGSAEVAGWLEQQGVQSVRPMNHGGFMEFPFGKVKGVNAIHSSSFPNGSYAGNPLGFVVHTKEANFYYGGDTALTMDMQLIPLWGKIDFAVLPIGSNFTMDVADAIKASDFIQCNKIVGVHYNTFELIKINTQKAKANFEQAGKTLLLPSIGETIEIK